MTIKIRKDAKFTDWLLSVLRQRYDERKKERIGIAPIHVSDILPSACIRKQYYSRLLPERDTVGEESLHHFIRGEASEFAISELANSGVSQANLEFEGLVAHPDIMNESQIVELKDTLSGKRLDITDSMFLSYLRQLLYYLVITGIENGILSIRYSNQELRWAGSDEKGDRYLKPKNAKSPGIESWSVHLPKDDITRDIIRNEINRRKKLLIKALEYRNASVLPRLVDPLKSKKCPYCPYFDICNNVDGETPEAIDMALEKDLLDISGVIDFKPFADDR